MDFSWLSRTELLLGRNGLETLAQKHVLIVGMGGVGSFAAEFVCRAGVGKMTIVGITLMRLVLLGGAGTWGNPLPTVKGLNCEVQIGLVLGFWRGGKNAETDTLCYFQER